MTDEQPNGVYIPKWFFMLLAIFVPLGVGGIAASVKVQMDSKQVQMETNVKVATLTVKVESALEMQDEIDMLRSQLRDVERNQDRRLGNPAD